MTPVTLGQPAMQSESAFRAWVQTAIKELERASHQADPQASQLTPIGLFMAQGT